MQSMAIHPADWIDIKAESVIRNSDGFYEPLLVVECPMSNPQVKNIGQVQPGKKPAEYEVSCANQQARPGPELRRGAIHAGEHVQNNDQIANDIVYFHGGSPWGYSN
jgi:hypothetical protein